MIAVVAVVALAGCAALGDVRAPGDGDGGTDISDGPADFDDAHVRASDSTTDAVDVNYTARIAVDESIVGSELTDVGAAFPRDHFEVDGAKHTAVRIGVDTDGTGAVDRAFDEGHVSGVNNNDYSFDVTLDAGYTLQSGDVVVVQYPSVSNPGEAGEYPVTVRLNDEQRASGNVTLG